MVLRVILWAILLLAAAWLASPVLAQEGTWPAYPFSGPDLHALQRGPGGYLSPWKLGICWLLFLGWVRTTDWANRDCQTLGLPYAVWNTANFLPFFLALFLLAFTVPVFPIGLLLLLLSYGVPLGIYIWQRNLQVPPHERVLTRDHLRHLISRKARAVGVAIDDQPKAAHEKGVPLQLTPMGGRSSQEDQANVIAARQSPGFLVARELVADVLAHRADRVMLDYHREAVAVRYMIDGVWHELPNRAREDADVMLAVLKKISALDMNERRARQQGRFGAEAAGQTYVAQLVSQGTQTGERVTLQLVDQSAARFTLETVGMREKMQEQWKQHLAAKKGFLLLSAMPSGGLTTTLLAALNATDRFMRNFVALQDKGRSEPMADNVDLETYDAAAGEAPAERLTRILRSEPNVIVMPELPDAATVKLLCEHARSDLLVVGTIRAKEAVEALLRVLLLKVPAKDFAPAATAVLNQRLVRKLCPACRQAYAPPPELLAKLGIPAGRVQAFYRPPVPGDAREKDREEVCPECRGLGYLGRTAVFELLQVSDPLREALVQQPKLELLRQIVRKTGHRSLQEEGIVLVARGVTSLAELSRVLKQ